MLGTCPGALLIDELKHCHFFCELRSLFQSSFITEIGANPAGYRRPLLVQSESKVVGPIPKPPLGTCPQCP